MTQFDDEISAESIKKIMNNYIIFYKKEIQDINLFNGIEVDDMGSTNIQLEMFYSEMMEYVQVEENLKNVKMITESDNKLLKFVIYKNDAPYCTSNLLFAVLIEIVNLKEDDSENKYEIKLHTKKP